MSQDWRDQEWQARALRLLAFRRNVQKVTMGLIVLLLLLSFFIPPEIGRLLLPIAILSLSTFTVVSGYVAHQLAFTGIGLFDGSDRVARGVGIVWMFAGFFLAIFGLSYFFT